MALTAEDKTRYRFIMLRLLATRQYEQGDPLDHITLAMTMRDIRCGVGEYDVIEMLRYLCELGLVTYKKGNNRLTHDVEVANIEVTAAGIAAIEKKSKEQRPGI